MFHKYTYTIRSAIYVKLKLGVCFLSTKCKNIGLVSMLKFTKGSRADSTTKLIWRDGKKQSYIYN